MTLVRMRNPAGGSVWVQPGWVVCVGPVMQQQGRGGALVRKVGEVGLFTSSGSTLSVLGTVDDVARALNLGTDMEDPSGGQDRREPVEVG